MPHEFNFSNVIAVPSVGQVGGIAILWHDHLLHISDIALTDQEIHCMVQVIPSPVAWLFSAIYAHNNRISRLAL